MAALVAAIVLAYSGSLNAPFVYDDTLAIPENPTIRRLWPLTPVLLPQAEGGLTVSGRPVLNLSLAINHAIGGKAAWSYHVFNVLMHAGSALLLFGIVRRTVARAGGRTAPDGSSGPSDSISGREQVTALAIAALWALHPLLTQAVTYTVQRAESLMGFFYLLALYAFARAAASGAGDEKPSAAPQRRWLAVSVVGCLLGMGTKEVMATAPLVIFLYDRTFVAGTFRAAWESRRGYYLLLCGTWLLLAALVISTGGNRGGTVGIGTGVPLWAYPLTQFQAVTRYLALSIWPYPLVFEYGTLWVKRAAEVMPYALAVLPLMAATAVALRRWPKLGFLGAWVFVILAPTSLMPGTIQMIVEHRMYLPFATVAVLVVISTQRWLGRKGTAATLVLAAALGVLTYQRNHDYRSHLALWSDTVNKRPQNPRAHDGLAEAYDELGRFPEAIHHRREAVRLQPNESTYHYNLAMTLAAANQRDEAIRHYQRALELDPNEPRTHNNLAILLGETGNDAVALSHYAEVVRLRPADAFYRYNYGVALMRAGRYADAVASYEAVLRLQSDHADAHFNLGTALMRLNRVQEALEHYVAALKLKPADSEDRITFGGALLVANRPNDALTEFRRVLSVRPQAVEAMFGAGNALAALRQTEEAVRQYEAVLHLAPDHVATHFKLANALLDLDRVSDAVVHYHAALKLTPNDAEAHHNLGVAFARQERWAEARREFETALSLKPDYADARRNLTQLKTLLDR